jgi:hypothetical protein
MNLRAQLTAASLCAALSAGALYARPDLIAHDGFNMRPRPNLAGADGGMGWSSAWMDGKTGLITSRR